MAKWYKEAGGFLSANQESSKQSSLGPFCLEGFRWTTYGLKLDLLQCSTILILALVLKMSVIDM